MVNVCIGICVINYPSGFMYIGLMLTLTNSKYIPHERATKYKMDALKKGTLR